MSEVEAAGERRAERSCCLCSLLWFTQDSLFLPERESCFLGLGLEVHLGNSDSIVSCHFLRFNRPPQSIATYIPLLARGTEDTRPRLLTGGPLGLVMCKNTETVPCSKSFDRGLGCEGDGRGSQERFPEGVGA